MVGGTENASQLTPFPKLEKVILNFIGNCHKNEKLSAGKVSQNLIDIQNFRFEISTTKIAKIRNIMFWQFHRISIFS